MTVAWPALISIGNENTLLYVSGQDEWDSDPDLHAWRYDPQDRLVDTQGREHTLVWVSEGGQGIVEPVASGTMVSPQRISALMEGHLITVDAEMDDYRQRLEASPEDQWARITIECLAERQS